MTYTNRITDFRLEPITSFVFNPANWRIHPVRQQTALRGSLLSVGWVEPIIVNLRTGEEWPEEERHATLVNGHMRVTLALKEGETAVPTVFVDLNPEEEAFVLASLDPLAALAQTDNGKLLDIVARLPAQNEVIRAALRGAGIEIRENFQHIAGVTAQGAADDGQAATGRPKERQIHAGPTNNPADRERYPLAIVLDRRDYETWLAWKKKNALSSDTAALRAFLSKFVEEDNSD